MKAREIDCRRQSRGASTDDQAIENGFIHAEPMDCRTGGSRLARHA
jgi:hypothetical protein